MSPSSVHLSCLVAVCLSVCSVSVVKGGEFVPSPKDLMQAKPEKSSAAEQQGVPVIDVSKLTPEQRHFLAMRMELIRRRRAEMAAAKGTGAEIGADREGAESGEDLDGANTLGLGAAALPFLGLYGLGLGGLGVGLGPLAFTGFLG